MKLEQSFEVQAPLERVWNALIDVERVAPCLPGASVTGRNPDGSYNGEFKVKIGPTSAAYSGKLHMEDVDEAKHSATMQAAGTDKRGQGGAKATIVSSVTEAAGGATTVNVSTDYHITGRLARFGRGGMIEEISNRLLGEFASSLQGMLAGSGADAPAKTKAKSGTTDAAPSSAPAPPEPPPAPGASAGAAGVPSTPAAQESAAAVGNGAAAGSPPRSEPVPPPTPPPTAGPETAPTAATDGPASESEPLDALSLARAVAAKKLKSNPFPFLGVLAGFLVALRALRRRR
jgi:carbon monoxide dehydrogenase subunit G